MNEYDPNAPWNQPYSPSELYGDRAKLEIETEINSLDALFVNWCNEHITIDGKDEYTEDDFKDFSNIRSIRELYTEFRYDALVQLIHEDACSEYRLR